MLFRSLMTGQTCDWAKSFKKSSVRTKVIGLGYQKRPKVEARKKAHKLLFEGEKKKSINFSF